MIPIDFKGRSSSALARWRSGRASGACWVGRRGLIAAGVALGYGYTAVAEGGQSAPTAQERAACPQAVEVNTRYLAAPANGAVEPTTKAQVAALRATATAERARVAGLPPTDRVRKDTERLAAINESMGDAMAGGHPPSEPLDSIVTASKRLASDCKVPYISPR